MTWTIDGNTLTAQAVVSAPTTCDGGFCVSLANLSPADTLYWATDKSALEAAKSNFAATGLPFGTPLLAGEKQTLPWVNKTLYVINYTAGSTPNDQFSAEQF
jgi:hypothetical protein